MIESMPFSYVNDIRLECFSVISDWLQKYLCNYVVNLPASQMNKYNTQPEMSELVIDEITKLFYDEDERNIDGDQEKNETHTRNEKGRKALIGRQSEEFFCLAHALRSFIDCIKYIIWVKQFKHESPGI